MNFDFTHFDIPDIQNWREQLLKEAKSDQATKYVNEIENIKIDISDKDPTCDFQSEKDGSGKSEWSVAAWFQITDAFDENTEILKCLEHGVNHIYLNILGHEPNWEKVFENIVLEYIHVTICFDSISQINSFSTFLKKENEKNISISIDPLRMDHVDLFKDTEVAFSIRAFELEQIGANTSEQLAFLLYGGEILLQKGTDPSRIEFEIGIGSNFFIEISKIKALKWLWNHVLAENNIESHNVHILARSGWTNKSLQDTETNLLRQTTEALSAISGGASSVLLHTNNEILQKPGIWFDRRMALNISHILREEAFAGKVNDPLNGSYIVRMLTKEIVLNSWNIFLEFIDASGDINTKNLLTEKVKTTREKRRVEFAEGNKKLIGINLFKTDHKPERWPELPTYLDLEFLVYEKLLKP